MSDISQLSDEELAELAGYAPTAKRDISTLSDTELQTLTQENPPGPVTGFLDEFNESIAATIGLPASGVELAAEAAGLPEYVDIGGVPVDFTKSNLSGRGLKRLMTDIGMTSGLQFEERSPAGKIGARGGQIFGMTAPMAIGMGILSRGVNLTKTMMARMSPTAVEKIIESAARYPKSFWTTEAGYAVGAITGATFGEAAFPGNGTALFMSEMLGTLVNPAGQLVKLTGKTGNQVKSFATSFTQGAKEEQAALVLRNLLEESGEDVPALIKMLDQPEKLTLTPSMKTGSPLLTALEQKLTSSHPQFNEAVKGIQQGAYTDLRQIIDNLVSTGDPALLRVAAKLRKQYFDDIITARLNAAKRNATESSAKLPSTKGEVDVQKLYETSLKELRKVESEIWEKIPKDISLNPTNLRATLKTAKGELLKEETLPLNAEILQSINRFLKKGATSGELLKLRNRALTANRELRAQGKYREARLVGDIAESTLDDLGELGIDSVTEARAFSSSLHENFIDTFAGATLQTGKSGRKKMSPEMVLEKAFGAGGTAGKLRMNELVSAGKYADNAMLKPIIGDAVRNEEERFLRTLASETMEDGIVNASKLEGFKVKNAKLLDQFPELAKQIDSAGNATKLLKNTEDLTGRVNKAILRKSAFANVLEVENPTVAVTKVLQGKNPERDYQKISSLAKRGGPGATEGLKTSTLDSILSKSKTADGMSFSKFKSNLLDPPARGQPSILTMMQREGVITPAAAKELKKIIEKAAEIETRIGTSREMGAVIDEPDQLFDLLVRVVGANVGGHSAIASSSGAGLVVASATVRTFRNFMEKMPSTRIVDVLVEASESPEVMSLLLKKAKTPKEAQAIISQLRAPFISAGIIAGEEEGEL